MHPIHPMQKLLLNNRRQGKFQIRANAEMDEATIYLYDMIVNTDDEAEWWGGVSPQSFITALNDLTAGTIHLRVNSPGGSVFAARAMEQAIREHRSNIIVHVDGLAASAASFLIMAASEIRMAPGSFLMIHKAWTWTAGNSDDLEKEAALLKQIDSSLAKTYAKRSGQPETDIATWMADETWIEASTAVDLGFANSVAEEEGSQAESMHWNLSAYRRPPSMQTSAQTQPPPQLPDRDALRRAALKAIIPA